MRRLEPDARKLASPVLRGGNGRKAVPLPDSTAQRLDGAGNVLTAHGFDAFGASLTANAAPADPYAGYGAQWGYRADAETGLLLLGQRYYDPASGRFLNRDPAGYGGGIGLYGYCGSNPVNAIDPSGLWQIIVSVGVIVANGSITFSDDGFYWGHGFGIGLPGLGSVVTTGKPSVDSWTTSIDFCFVEADKSDDGTTAGGFGWAGAGIWRNYTGRRHPYRWREWWRKLTPLARRLGIDYAQRYIWL